MTLKAVRTKTSTFGKKTVQFAPKTTPSSSVKTVTHKQKQTPTVDTIDVKDDEEAGTVTEDDIASLTEDKVANLFQDTSCKEQLDN